MQEHNNCLLPLIWYFSLSPCKVTHLTSISPLFLLHICSYSIHTYSFITVSLSIALFSFYLSIHFYTQVLSTQFHTHASLSIFSSMKCLKCLFYMSFTSYLPLTLIPSSLLIFTFTLFSPLLTSFLINFFLFPLNLALYQTHLFFFYSLSSSSSLLSSSS